MSLRDTFLNMLGANNPSMVKQDNAVFKSARDFLRYGNREKLYPDWSDVKMPDSDMYRGYSYAVIQKRSNKVATLAKNNLSTWAKPEVVDAFQDKDETVLHPYLKLIEDSTEFSEKQFWKNISIYLDLAGRYYLGVIRNQIVPSNPNLPVITTDATRFVLLNPYEIRRVIDKDKNVAGYIERKKDGRYREWPKHQIIEMRELNPFDPENSQWAMTDAAKEAVYTINQSSDYTRQSLHGNIEAPGIITTDVLLNDQDFANFRARVTQHQKGEPLFGNGTGAIKWDAMQIDLDKAALMDINEINRTTLFAVSGTSKTSLGIEQSGTTRETARVQSEQFIADTAQPRLEDIVDFLNLDYKKNYFNEYKKTGYYIEVKSAVGRDYDTEQKATALKQSQFQLAMQLMQAGYTEQSAYQFAEGEIDFGDLELEKGLDKPQNPENPGEGEGSNENSPNSPNNGPQSGSGAGDDNNTTSEQNSLETADNDVQDKDVLTTDLNELEPHSDLVENKTSEDENSLPFQANGGPGSGNFGHSGRPGEVGGSGNGSAIDSQNELDNIESYHIPEATKAKLSDLQKINTYNKIKEYLASKGIEVDTDAESLKGERKDEVISSPADTFVRLAIGIEAYQDTFGSDALSSLKKVKFFDNDEDSQAAYYYSEIGEKEPKEGQISFRQWGNIGKTIFHELAHAFQDSHKKSGEDAVTYSDRMVKEAGLSEKSGSYMGASQSGNGKGLQAERFADAFAKGFASGNKEGLDFIERVAQIEKKKNHCTCEHDHKVETFFNQVSETESKEVKEAYNEFLTEIRALEKETIDAAARKLTVNAFDESDIIGKRKKATITDKIKNAIRKYWWLLLPLFANNGMSKRNKEFGENIIFTFDNALQNKVINNADRVAKGHMDTILNDILEASNKVYTDILEGAAADLVVTAYRDNPEKFSAYFDHEPTRADALASIRKTDLLEQNRRIYDRANKMAFEGYERGKIVKAVRAEYKDISENRATLIARNETARAFGKSQFEADRQFLNAVGKLGQAYKIWYSRRPAGEQDKICPFCRELIEQSNINPVPFDKPFVEYGNSLEVVEDGKVKIFTADYEDIEGGTLHPNCSCGYKLVFKNAQGEFVKTLNGGSGSGNFGHSGRPGEVGGSGKGSGKASESPKKMSSAEAIAEYQNYAYEPLNQQLRGGKEIEGELKQIDDGLQEAFNRAEPIKGQSVAYRFTGTALTNTLISQNPEIGDELAKRLEKYRGMKDDLTGKPLDEEMVASMFWDDNYNWVRETFKGKVYEDKGYSSTSKERDSFNNFANGAGNRFSVSRYGFNDSMFISIPAGSKVLDLGEDGYIAGSGEHEIILNKGAKFTIKDVMKDNASGTFMFYVDYTDKNGVTGKLTNGGPGSGNFGHAGREGEVGGSAKANYNSGEDLFNAKMNDKLDAFRDLSPEEQAVFCEKAMEMDYKDMPQDLANTDFQRISYALGIKDSPKTVGDKEFGEAIQNGEEEFFRAVKGNGSLTPTQVAERLYTGEYTYQGNGDYCDGTYFTPDWGAMEYYMGKSVDTSDTAVVRCSVSLDANIYYSEPREPFDAKMVSVMNTLEQKTGMKQNTARAVALLGAGYDGWSFISGGVNKEYLCMLNRKHLTINKENFLAIKSEYEGGNDVE